MSCWVEKNSEWHKQPHKRKVEKKIKYCFICQLYQNNFQDNLATAVFLEDKNILTVPKQMLKVKEFYITQVIWLLIQELFYLKHHKYNTS